MACEPNDHLTTLAETLCCGALRCVNTCRCEHAAECEELASQTRQKHPRQVAEGRNRLELADEELYFRP